MTTINNTIPLVPENTTDPAAGLNQALNHVDGLLQLSVLNRQNDPPGSPTEGDRYIVQVGTGDWLAQDDKIARYINSAWQFYNAVIALNQADSKIWINIGGWAVYV